LALPHLLKYVYTHGTDEVIRRGKKIHAIGFVELVEYDNLFGSAVFRVKDDIYSTFYKVYIQKIKDPRSLSVRCTCPYNLGDICRHEAASLFQLQEMIDKNMLEADEVEYDQRHTVAKMKFIDLKSLRLLSSPSVFSEAEKFLKFFHLIHVFNIQGQRGVSLYPPDDCGRLSCMSAVKSDIVHSSALILFLDKYKAHSCHRSLGIDENL